MAAASVDRVSVAYELRSVAAAGRGPSSRRRARGGLIPPNASRCGGSRSRRPRVALVSASQAGGARPRARAGLEASVQTCARRAARSCLRGARDASIAAEPSSSAAHDIGRRGCRRVPRARARCPARRALRPVRGPAARGDESIGSFFRRRFGAACRRISSRSRCSAASTRETSRRCRCSRSFRGSSIAERAHGSIRRRRHRHRRAPIPASAHRRRRPRHASLRVRGRRRSSTARVSASAGAVRSGARGASPRARRTGAPGAPRPRAARRAAASPRRTRRRTLPRRSVAVAAAAWRAMCSRLLDGQRRARLAAAAIASPLAGTGFVVAGRATRRAHNRAARGVVVARVERAQPTAPAHPCARYVGGAPIPRRAPTSRRSSIAGGAHAASARRVRARRARSAPLVHAGPASAPTSLGHRRVVDAIRPPLRSRRSSLAGAARRGSPRSSRRVAGGCRSPPATPRRLRLSADTGARRQANSFARSV